MAVQKLLELNYKQFLLFRPRREGFSWIIMGGYGVRDSSLFQQMHGKSLEITLKDNYNKIVYLHC
jgi:alpha-N-acetylglucosamine transferase